MKNRLSPTRKKRLKKQLRKESKLVNKNSMKILREFEKLEDPLQ